MKGQCFSEVRQNEKKDKKYKVRKIIVCVYVCLLFQRKNRAKGERGGECRDGEQLGIGHLLESIS